MSENQKTEFNLDERIATYLRGQTDGFGRRSMLMKLGKILLRASGLTLIPLLPVDRRFQASAQTGCDPVKTCGMCGYLCSTTCCNQSGGFSKCPTCTGMVKSPTSWQGCCCSSPPCCGLGTIYSYTDCCTPNHNDSVLCRTSTHCTAACYPNFPNYCSSGYYSCTIVTAGGSC
jgi:hypothetical protein